MTTINEQITALDAELMDEALLLDKLKSETKNLKKEFEEAEKVKDKNRMASILQRRKELKNDMKKIYDNIKLGENHRAVLSIYEQ